jgi:hypothetical protein
LDGNKIAAKSLVNEALSMSCEQQSDALQAKVSGLMAEFSAESEALAKEVKDKAEEIDPDIDTSGPDVWIGLDFDITWERVDFSLDLPEVVLKDQRWSVDVPQVIVNNQEIVFHTPSVRMKTVETGRYPETVCKMVTKSVGLGVKIDVPECTVKWTPIYIDVPETFMQEQKIVLGVPEFSMGSIEFVLGIPEFSMKTVDLALHLPRFTLKNISVESKKAEERGKALTEEASAKSQQLKERLRETAKADLGSEVTSLFDCYQTDLISRRNETAQQFEQGISLLQAAVNSMIANKMPPDHDAVVTTNNRLSELISKRDSFFILMEEKLKELQQQQQSFFEELLG